MPYQQSAPMINPNTFPYMKKFTRAETDAIIERTDYYRSIMVDMVGPSGVTMWIDEGTIANIAFHLAMVELDYIWPERQRDEDMLIADTVIWRLKKEHEPPAEPVDEDRVSKEAAAARDQIRRQLTPEVRRRLAAKLAEEFEHETIEPKGDQ